MTRRVTFSPPDDQLGLNQEGYRPGVLRLVLRPAAKTSFANASGDLQELSDVAIRPTHVRRLAERVGREWADARDAEVHAFRSRRPVPGPNAPKTGARWAW
ncbi:MAG TPA: hypothetical protein VH092_15165 [Urbifossiella sp.]|nr:hypothetical protein [Urbifossiella sp.]